VSVDGRAGGERWVHCPPGHPAHTFDQCAELGHRDPRDPASVVDGVSRLVRDENRQTDRVAVEWTVVEWPKSKYHRFLDLLFGPDDLKS